MRIFIIFEWGLMQYLATLCNEFANVENASIFNSINMKLKVVRAGFRLLHAEVLLPQ